MSSGARRPGARRILLLGFGRMGQLVFQDLCRTADFDRLIVADGRDDLAAAIGPNPDPRVSVRQTDVDDDAALASLLADADIVIELLPVRYTLRVAEAAVAAGVHMISSVFLDDWSVQDPEGLARQADRVAAVDRTARTRGLTVLRKFGMDPGLDIVIAGAALDALDATEILYTYGAGFPAHSLSTANPLGYKFTWSVVDTIRSYAIPGRVVRDGRTIDIPADGMFTPGNFHHLDVPDLGGPLECFVNGDANELTTLFPGRLTDATSLGRFICRWPGHAAFWEKMVKCGFNRLEPVNVDGTMVDPAAFCAALLGSQEQFAYGPGEQDVALIRADARGTKHGRPTRVIQQLIDRRDLETGYTAMQRTVAFPMSIGAQMILDGRLTQRGVVEPSAVPAEPLFAGLAERGLTVTRHTEAWNGATAPDPTVSS